MKGIRKKIALFLVGVTAGASLTFTSCDFEAVFNKDEPSVSSSSSSSGLEGQKCNVDEILDNLTAYQVKSVAFDGNYIDKRDEEAYSYNRARYEVSAKINVSEGDGDMYWYEKEEYLEREPYSFYQNIYMRDWTPFAKSGVVDEMQTPSYPDGAKAVANPAAFIYENFVGNIWEFPYLKPILGEDLSKYEKYVSYLFEIMGYEVLGKEVKDVAATAFSFANAQIISLADVTEAIVEGEGELTLDLDKTANTLVKDFKALVDSITEKTTLEDLLKNPLIDKYMESIFRTAKAEEVVSKFLEVYTHFEKDFAENISLSNMAKILSVISIQPDKNSTAYDYLVKLVTSENFDDLLKSMTGSKFSVVSTPITEFASLDDIHEWASHVWTTEDALCLNIYNDDVLSFEDMQWTYTVENNYLTGASYSANAACNEDESVVALKGELVYSGVPMSLINAENLLVTVAKEPIFENGNKVRRSNDLQFIATFFDNKIIDIKVEDASTHQTLRSNYDAANHTFTFTSPSGVEETCQTEIKYYWYRVELRLKLEYGYEYWISWDSDGSRDVFTTIKEYDE